MGVAVFKSNKISTNFKTEEVLGENLEVDDREYKVNCVSIGNPHYLIDNEVKIKMLGGDLKIEIDNNWNIKMTGEVRQIAEGVLSDEVIEDLNK